jgi:hypothetical protein
MERVRWYTKETDASRKSSGAPLSIYTASNPSSRPHASTLAPVGIYPTVSRHRYSSWQEQYNLYAPCNLALRDVLNVTLPIAIAFPGNEDLPSDEQQSLLDLRPAVEMLDVIATLSDEFTNLRDGAWAVKPFAALASRFEQVILVDTDVVFVQPPETLLDHPGYRETGALFFHERQLEKATGNERQEFLKAQTKDMELLDTCCEKDSQR